MNLKILSLAVLAFCLVSLPSFVGAETTTVLQYQETPDAVYCSANWNASFPSTNTYDGDWDTYGASSDGSAVYCTYNYTIPANATAVYFQTKDIATLNLSAEADCTPVAGVMMLRSQSLKDGLDEGTAWSCFNSTLSDWVYLRGSGSLNTNGYYLYDEAIYWNVTQEVDDHITTVSTCQTLSLSNENYLLDTDLYGQSGSCFRIDGTNVTFDCQNHLIEGDGTGSSDKGIYVSSAGNVTIQNCIINHFAIGVRMPFFAGTSADNVAIKNIQMTNNYTSGTTYGIYVVNSTNILVDNVTITNSSTSTGSRYGIYMDANSDSIIRNSRFYGLSVGVYYPTYAIDALVQNNEFTNMTFYGFRFPSTASITNATLDSNSFSGNKIYNIFYSQFSTLATPSVCEQMTITGNTGKGGLPILFYNTAGQTIENHVNDVADIMLCNSSGSVIRNILCEDTCENFIFTYANNLEIENVTLNKYNQFIIYKSPTVVTLTDVRLYNATYSALTCSGVSCSITDSIISSITPFTRVGSGANVLFGGYLYNTTTPMEFNLTNSLIEGYALTSSTGYASALDTFTNYRANIVNSILRGNQTAFMASNTSGNVTMRDSTLFRLSADTAYADFKSYGNVANGSKYDLYNVTFDTYNITSDTVLNVYWKLDINNTLEALVDLYDNNSVLLSSSSDAVQEFWLQEYNVTAGNVATDSAEKSVLLDMSKTGYTSVSDSLEMTENRAYVVSLAAIPITEEGLDFTGLLSGAGEGLGNFLTSITDPTVSLIFGIAIASAIILLIAAFAGVFKGTTPQTPAE